MNWKVPLLNLGKWYERQNNRSVSFDKVALPNATLGHGNSIMKEEIG